MKKIKQIPAILFGVAALMYLLACFTLYKGYDKMHNYYNSENYYSLNHNAYVGGDAYNYIINGTYATAYYTLTAGLIVAGTVIGCTGFILNDKGDPATTAPVTAGAAPAEMSPEQKKQAEIDNALKF